MIWFACARALCERFQSTCTVKQWREARALHLHSSTYSTVAKVSEVSSRLDSTPLDWVIHFTRSPSRAELCAARAWEYGAPRPSAGRSTSAAEPSEDVGTNGHAGSNHFTASHSAAREAGAHGGAPMGWIRSIARGRDWEAISRQSTHQHWRMMRKLRPLSGPPRSSPPALMISNFRVRYPLLVSPLARVALLYCMPTSSSYSQIWICDASVRTEWSAQKLHTCASAAARSSWPPGTPDTRPTDVLHTLPFNTGGVGMRDACCCHRIFRIFINRALKIGCGKSVWRIRCFAGVAPSPAEHQLHSLRTWGRTLSQMSFRLKGWWGYEEKDLDPTLQDSNPDSRGSASNKRLFNLQVYSAVQTCKIIGINNSK